MAAKRKTGNKKEQKITSVKKMEVKKEEASNKVLKVEKNKIKLALVAVLIVAIAYLLKGYFIAATVNGRPISRIKLVQELEKTEGSGMLENLITRELLKQEVKDKGIMVTDEEIDGQLQDIKTTLEGQGQDLDTILAVEGITMEEVRDQIKFQLEQEKLLNERVQITDEEVVNYLEENGDFIEGETEEERLEIAREQLRQQQLTNEYSALVGELREKAQINYWAEKFDPTASLAL